MKRVLSCILVIAMLISNLPTTVLAVAEDNLCEHHAAHTEECGYAAAVAEKSCGHAHTDDCKKVTQECVHEHTPECYPPAVEDDMPSGEATACAHVGFCSIESGCITEEIVCIHTEHDESCGYAAAVAEQPCQYECKICAAQALINALPDPATVTPADKGELDGSLNAIVQAVADVPDADREKLDLTRYYAVVEKLEGPQGEPQTAMQINIFIASSAIPGISGGSYSLEVEPTDKIEDIKAKIRDKLGYEPSIQVLTFNETKLEDGNTLQDYSIQKDSTLNLTIEATPVTVTFDANGGSVTPTSAVTTTEGKLETLPTPTKENRTFEGWVTDLDTMNWVNGGNVVNYTAFAENTTIYAVWSVSTHVSISWVGDTPEMRPDSVGMEWTPSDGLGWGDPITAPDWAASFGLYEHKDYAFSVSLPNSHKDLYTVSYDGYAVTMTHIHKYVDGSCVCGVVEEASILASGECGAEGDNLLWALARDGRLTISGTGEMASYSTDSPAPWAKYAADIKIVIMETGITKIGGSAFYECTNLTNVTIPEGVSTMEAGAFWKCSSLNNVVIPQSITEIWAYMFSECSSLTSITLPESITAIGERSFDGCVGLTNITIPADVSFIASFAFNNCSNLKTITFQGNAPTTFGGGVFTGVNATAYYPSNNATWTSQVMQNYGGAITWIAQGSENNTDDWIVPCDYTSLTIPFGAALPSNAFHQGIDLAAPVGNPVYAVKTGKILTAGYSAAAGNYVKIDHEDGFVTIYQHMNHCAVSQGETVSQGQIIGSVGNTGDGSTENAHLHFGITLNGVYVNPENYITFAANPDTPPVPSPPAVVTFEDTKITAGEGFDIRIALIETGEITSISYRLLNESGETVKSWEDRSPYYYGASQLSFGSTDPGIGTYHCEVTMTDDQEKTYTVTTEVPLVVTNDLMLRWLHLSTDRIALGEDVDITLETLGEGAPKSIRYQIYTRDMNTEIASFQDTDLTGTYTPTQAGEYTCKVIFETETEVFTDFANFSVFDGCYVRELRILSGVSNHKLNDTVLLRAFTSGTGTPANVKWEIFNGWNEPALETSEGTSLEFSFKITDDTIRWYRCVVTLTDEDGNISTDDIQVSLGQPSTVQKQVRLVADEYYYDAYVLGDTIPFRVTCQGIEDVDSVRYAIYEADANWNETPYKTFDNMTTTFDYVTDRGGKFRCEVYVTDASGNQYSAGMYFEVKDPEFVLENVTASRYKVSGGDAVTFVCNTTGDGDFESITYEIKGDNGAYATHTGKDLRYTYTLPETLDTLYVECCVTVRRANGTVYTKSAYCEVSTGLISIFGGIHLSAEVVKPYQPVTITVDIPEDAEYQSISYRISVPNISSQPIEGQDGQFIYTPKEVGRYTFNVEVTRKDGSKISTNKSFTVTNGLQVTSLSSDSENAAVGKPITFKPVTSGEGSIVYASYSVYNGNALYGPSELAAEYEGTSAEYAFTPAKGGYYYCNARFTNDEGVTFSFTSDRFNVQEGLCLTGIECSKTTVAVGEAVTFTPIYAGEGNVQNIHYWLMYNHGDTVNSHVEANAPKDHYTWMPNIPGSYGCQVTMVNDKGILSGYTVDIEVVEENLSVTGVTLDKQTATIGDTVTATVGLSGNGVMSSAAFTVYYRADEESEEEKMPAVQRTDTSYSFQPDKEGIWRVECEVVTAMGNKLTGTSDAIQVQPAKTGHPAEDLTPGTQIEIDGQKYTVGEDGKIWFESGEDRIVTSHGSGTSDLKDPHGITAHQQYPTSMEVHFLRYDNTTGKYVMEKIAPLTNILTYRGTSIRMTGNQGIRIFTSISESKRNALIDGSLLQGTPMAGYKLVEYGTLFGWASNGSDLVYDANVTGNRSVAYGGGVDAVFARQGGEIWYTGMLVNLRLDLCDDELLLRPYMVLKNDAGETVVIHGGTLQRNIGYVAYQNKDYKPNQAAQDFIWNIIHAVYGKDFKG